MLKKWMSFFEVYTAWSIFCVASSSYIEIRILILIWNIYVNGMVCNLNMQQLSFFSLDLVFSIRDIWKCLENIICIYGFK